MAVFGGPVPIANVDRNLIMASQNFYHLGTCGDVDILLMSLMNSCASPSGRAFATALDFAVIQDLGYPMRSSIANYSTSTEVLQLPFVLVPGTGVFDVDLVLKDATNIHFELSFADSIPLGSADPAMFNSQTSELTIPRLEVDLGGVMEVYEITMTLIPDSNPPRFALATATLIE